MNPIVQGLLIGLAFGMFCAIVSIPMWVAVVCTVITLVTIK